PLPRVVLKFPLFGGKEEKLLPNIKQQEKRMRQAEKRRLRNKSHKSEIRTYIRGFDASLKRGDREESEIFLSKAVKALDKAASAGAIHKNNAANRKQRLMQKFNQSF
ncbi:MAG: 30S ribosomal protein S20, partial [Actinomycetota bacterium]